jgi:uncharacterized cupin superfamily protein
VGEIIVRKMEKAEAEGKGIDGWGVWEKEPSEFEWAYTDEEHCYILEGRAEIRTDDGTVEIGKGDYVVFPRGLKCTWVVKEGLRKHYRFQ